MADPVTWALIIGGASALAGGGMSFMQAKEGAAYAKDVRNAQTAAARTQAKQVYRQADLEKQKTLQRHHLIESRIRVAAGESGMGLGGTYLALERQDDIDAGRDIAIIMENAQMGARGAMSQIGAKPPTINPLISGMLGFVQGAQSGLSIVNSGANLKLAGTSAPPASIPSGYSTSNVTVINPQG